MEVIYMPEKLKQEGELQGKNFTQCPDCKTDLKIKEKYVFKQITEDTDTSLCSTYEPCAAKGKCLAVKKMFIICQKCYDDYMDEIRWKRTYIRVFRRDNDVAKRNGAKLDWKLKMWYIAPYATPMQRAYLLNCFQVIEFDYEADGALPLGPSGPRNGEKTGVDDTDSAIDIMLGYC